MLQKYHFDFKLESTYTVCGSEYHLKKSLFVDEKAQIPTNYRLMVKHFTST